MPAIPFLPVALRALHARHPDALVTIVEAREDELLDRLRRRDIELAILRLAVLDPGEDLRFDRFFDEKLCVVAAKDHPLATRRLLTWPELLQQDWVMPPANCIFYKHVLATLGKAGLEMPRQRVEAYAVSQQYAMVLHAGMLGFGLRSKFEFAPDKTLLVRLAFEFALPTQPVGAASLVSHELSPLALQLIDAIRQQAQEPAVRREPVVALRARA